MKKNSRTPGMGRGLLKRTGEGILLYMLLCQAGTLAGYSRGADLKITARIAGGISFLQLSESSSA